MAKHDFRLEKEAVLFERMSLQQVRALEVLLRFEDGSCRCRLRLIGSGEAVDPVTRTATDNSFFRMAAVRTAAGRAGPSVHDRPGASGRSAN